MAGREGTSASWDLSLLVYLGYPRCATNFKYMFFKRRGPGLPGGPMIKNPPANAEDTDSTPGLGRSHMTGGTKPEGHNCWAHGPRACALQQEKSPQWEAWALQLERSPCSAQLEKAHREQWRLSTAKTKLKKKKEWTRLRVGLSERDSSLWGSDKTAQASAGLMHGVRASCSRSGRIWTWSWGKSLSFYRWGNWGQRTPGMHSGALGWP